MGGDYSAASGALPARLSLAPNLLMEGAQGLAISHAPARSISSFLKVPALDDLPLLNFPPTSPYISYCTSERDATEAV